MKHMGRRGLALFLVAMMLFSLMPTSALAQEIQKADREREDKDVIS